MLRLTTIRPFVLVILACDLLIFGLVVWHDFVVVIIIELI